MNTFVVPDGVSPNTVVGAPVVAAGNLLTGVHCGPGIVADRRALRYSGLLFQPAVR